MVSSFAWVTNEKKKKKIGMGSFPRSSDCQANAISTELTPVCDTLPHYGIYDLLVGADELILSPEFHDLLRANNYNIPEFVLQTN